MATLFNDRTRNPDSSRSWAAPAAPGASSQEQSALATLVDRAEGIDPSFREHARNVALLSVEIGKALGLPREELDVLEFAAAFHDVGKVRVPPSVIAKTGSLDDEEWDCMRRHPGEGERLLEPHVDSPEILAIVRSHHERWDGAGYPDGLAGDEIPLGARIVAVADAFTAMIEPRPYRAPRRRAAARAELLGQAGCQFDAECARAAFAVTATAA
jgi:HD-GYP domain-containing protein (c-di-GMP phosphodiesterase class II)